MMFFVISSLLLVLFPICSGIKCLTCGNGANNGFAKCDPGQTPGEMECPPNGAQPACYTSRYGNGTPNALGCDKLVSSHDGSNVACKLERTRPFGPLVMNCRCMTDFCNSGEVLKCLACKGKPTRGTTTTEESKLFGTDYVCEKGEKPVEKWYPLDEINCFNRKWTANNHRWIGCKKAEEPNYIYDYKIHTVPYCLEKSDYKECFCRTDGCNIYYEEPNEIKMTTTTTSKTKMSLSSIFITVALSSIPLCYFY